MKAHRSILLGLGTWTLLAVALAMGGCNGWGKKPPEPGPIVQRSTEELIKQINANNRLIYNLWSRVDISVELPGEKHSVGGHLILRKPSEYGQPPRDLLLKGSDTLGAVDFQMGSNSKGYWYMLDAPKSKDDAYSFVPYGEDSGAQAERTLDLLSVLGVYELAVDMEDKGSWPVLRGFAAPPYYKLSFDERLADGSLRAKKDVWWHRRKQQVDLIELFDEKGHRYLSASLYDHQQFAGPKLATKIHIVWHEEKLTLELKFRDVEVNSPTKVSDKNFVHRRPSWARGN